MLQFASIVGAAFILAAYAAHQGGWMGRESYVYHLLNMVGGVVLCVVAIEAFQVGFIILEAVWTLVSLGAILRLWRRASSARSVRPTES